MEYTITISAGWVVLIIFFALVGFTCLVYAVQFWFWWSINKQEAIQAAIQDNRLNQFRPLKHRWYRNIAVVHWHIRNYPERYIPYLTQGFMPFAIRLPLACIAFGLITYLVW